ncbi:MAG: YHS domain-containing (seleno)protein, partial [Alphaproteobacteria bacterium]|nr:YHS domain-containing (seleno)protein [Alphaproteobacteria bacterium]
VDSDNVALHGYDTVAYFTEGKPMKGSAEFEKVWQDARWQFASATNRDLFKANPDRYAPQYGGYCSGGLSVGEFADVDPSAWTIVDGKLYLTKNKDLRDAWRKAPEAHVANANYNWDNNRDKLRDNY